jgi:tetratricopeptide (TPR) repeat protein
MKFQGGRKDTKRGPTIVDLQIYNGEVEELFAIEATAASFGGYASKASLQKKRSVRRLWAKRRLVKNKAVALISGTGAREGRDDFDCLASTEFGADGRPRNAGTESACRDNIDAKGALQRVSSMIENNGMALSAHVQSATKEQSSEEVGEEDDDREQRSAELGKYVQIVDEGDPQGMPGFSSNLWEDARILADAALRGGNFIASLEMYLLSRELIERHMDILDKKIGTSNSRHFMDMLMEQSWVEAEILHGTGDAFYLLAQESAPSELEQNRKSKKERKQQKVKYNQLLQQAQDHLKDALIIKEGVLTRAYKMAREGEPWEGISFGSNAKHQDRIKMEQSLGSTLRLLANINVCMGNLDAARTQFRHARDLYIEAEAKLSKAFASFPVSVKWENLLGLALVSYGCGSYFAESNDFDKAIQAYTEALDMLLGVQVSKKEMIPFALCRAGTTPRYGNITDLSIALRLKIGHCFFQKKCFADALMHLCKVAKMLNVQLEGQRKAIEFGDGVKDPDCMTMSCRIVCRRIVYKQLENAYTMCSKIYSAASDPSEAAKAGEEASKMKELVRIEQSPEMIDVTSSQAIILKHIGKHHEEVGDTKLALKSYEVALDFLERADERGIGYYFAEKYWNPGSADIELAVDLLRTIGRMHNIQERGFEAARFYKRALVARIYASELHCNGPDLNRIKYFQAIMTEVNNNVAKKRVGISSHDRDFIKTLRGLELAIMTDRRSNSESQHKDRPFDNAVTTLVDAIIQETKNAMYRSEDIAALVLFRIGTALWKRDKKLDHALICMVKSLDLSMDSAPEKANGKSNSAHNIDQALQMNKADILENIGCIHLDLGNYEEAKFAVIGALQEQQMLLVRQPVKNDGRSVTRFKVARLSMKAGILHSKLNQPMVAEQLLRNSLNIIENATENQRGNDNTSASKSSASAKPSIDSSFYGAMEADVWHQLALVLSRMGSTDHATAAFEKAISLLIGIGKSPDDPKVKAVEKDISSMEALAYNEKEEKDDWSIGSDFYSMEDVSYEEETIDSDDSFDWGNDFDYMADKLVDGIENGLMAMLYPLCK